jgi:hypothetical protein
MIIDVLNHNFDLCPYCRNFVLIIRVPIEEISEMDIWIWRRKTNAEQIGLMVEYCDKNGIPVSDQERKAAA